MNTLDHQHFRMLVAEDDEALNTTLKNAFEALGYVVDTFLNGEAALTALKRTPYDVILLDVMLPNVDGIEILNYVKAQSDTPVILVTAKGAEEERILGLRMGADDYVAKPFNLTELELRVAAVIKRNNQPSATKPEFAKIIIDELLLDKSCLTATFQNSTIELTDTQFHLLWFLASNVNQVISKAELSEFGLNRALTQYDRSIDMHISRIRKKLNEIGFTTKRILTVHGKGFCFK